MSWPENCIKARDLSVFNITNCQLFIPSFMRKLPWFSTLSILIVVLALAACGKSTSNNNNTNTNVVLLTKATWKFDTAGVDLNRDGIIDQADETLESCFKDNTYIFKTDSTVFVDEGPTKCDGGDPQTATYPWTITGSNPAILKSSVNPILAEGLKVRTLTDTKLTVYKDTAVLGVSFWYIFSLKH